MSFRNEKHLTHYQIESMKFIDVFLHNLCQFNNMILCMFTLELQQVNTDVHVSNKLPSRLLSFFLRNTCSRHKPVFLAGSVSHPMREKREMGNYRLCVRYDIIAEQLMRLHSTLPYSIQL